MDQIEEIKNKTDIVQLVTEYVKLSKAGRNFKGLCPFHGEKTPSFMVNPELQIFKCFGCGEGGDVYAFLEKMEGVEFGEALKILAKRTGITLESFIPSKGEEDREKLYKIHNLAADFYHYLLEQHRLGLSARKYLEERKITGESIEKFKLGFAPDGWDFLIKYLRDKKNIKIQDLERAGLVVPSSKGGYDRFRNRIIFPLTNHRGQTVGFSGRVMPTASAEAMASQGAKYVNTPETEIYHKGDLLYGLDINKAEIKSAGWVVVVEGEIDALASRQAGVNNVVAIKGSALTGKQVDLLKRYVQTVVLALDADLAGDMAARRGIEIAQKAGLIIKVLSAKGLGLSYKDPGDWATQDPKGWLAAVKKAIPIYDFYIESAVERFGLEAEGKVKIGRELIPIWAGIEDEILKDHYVQKLAQVLEVDSQAVWKQIEKYSGTKNQEPNNDQNPTSKIQTQTRREIVEEYIVGLALRNNKIDQLISLSAMPAGRQVAQLFKTQFWTKVIEEIDPKLEVKEIVAKLPAQLRGRVEDLMLADEDEKGMDFDKEWTSALEDLEEIGVRENIEQAQKSGKFDEMSKLTVRLNQLTGNK